MPSGYVNRSAPLKPLSAHAWGILERLALGPFPSYTVNAGVQDRFRREGLVEDRRADPYGSGPRFYLFITEAGRQKLRARDA